MNNRETCSPRSLKRCGAITGALNIPSQHDAAHRSPDCALLQRGPFYIIPLISLKSAHGPGHRKMTATKQLLELLQASSKTQCGSLRLGEYRVVVE
ncbi:hypothetical protein ABVT39_006708, partial [Epinephelus coioides]